MNEHQQKQEKLQFLVKLTDKQAISTDFYLELSKKYQQISHHLLHLIKLFSKGFISFPNLDYWVNNLSIALDSTQYLKYGHSHPLFAYILRKYSLLVKQDNKNNNQRQVLQAIHNYQKSQYYNQTKHQQKWTNESKFLSSCQINEMIKKTTENMNYIQNPQCACCSPIFKRGSVVLNRNPEFSTIFGINQTKLFQSVVLEKYLCALANQGGGVLLFGADNIGFSVFVRGIFVNNEHSIVTIQQEIQTALQRLRPSCFFNIARVFVQQSSLSQNNTNQKQEDININRIVIRVCISPKQKNKLVYIETQKKLCHRVYESYQLSTQRELMKIVCQNKQNKEEPTSLYSKIVEKNKKKSFNRGHSSYISCTKPIDYRKQFKSITYLQKACNQQKQNCPQLPLTKKIDQKLQQLFFPYTHTSLLVVPNKNHDRYIIDFKIYLSECKLKCTMEKPFINYFKESMRSIWVISHEINIIKLKKNLKSFEQANALKTKTTITLMPVLNKFEFQKSKLNSEGINSFLKKFSRYFNKHLQVHQIQVQQPETAKIMMFSNFQSKTEAIFAYMILEELSVRPYFFKEAQTHLKYKDDPTEKQ